MDRYTRGFMRAFLVYFTVAADLRILMGSDEACSGPGQATETIRQSALMHNVEEAKIVEGIYRAGGRAHA